MGQSIAPVADMRHPGSGDGMVRSDFVLVQALRGIAALWVVLFHARESGSIERLAAILPDWVNTILFDSGHLGVPVFFALSGFVIAHSIRSSKVDLPFIGRFALRRSIRLDPPYWGAIAVVVAFAAISSAVQGEVHQRPSPEQLAAHLIYLQGILGYGQLNPVFWTLTFEVQFYLVLVFALAAFQALRKRTHAITAALLIFGPLYIVALVWGIGILPARPFDAFFFTLWFGFFVGVLGYWAVDDRRLLLPFLGLAAALCIAGSDLARACAATALLLHFTRRSGAIKTWLGWRWLQFLGAISYSLYLLHNPLYGASAFILARVVPATPGGAALLLFVALAVVLAGAILFWLILERPAQGLAKRVSPRPRERLPASADLKTTT